MDIYGKIKQQLIAIGGTSQSNGLVFLAEVVSVSGEHCRVEVDGMELSGVRLRAVVNEGSDYVLLTPKRGSMVLCIDLSGGELRDVAVINVSEIESVSIKIDSQTLKMNADGFVFNDGTLGGMVKVGDLTQRLNNLENDINNLKTAFSTWTPVLYDGGTALKAATTTWAGQQVAVTQQANIENEKVKH